MSFEISSVRLVTRRWWLPLAALGLWLATVSPVVAGTSGASYLPSSVQTEANLIDAAAKVAASGDVAGAWRILGDASAVPTGSKSSQVGYRVMATAGFLRSLNKYAEAEALVRLAMAGRWTDPNAAASDSERGQVRFWQVQMVAEVLQDPEQALALAEDRGAREEDDERMPAQRERLHFLVKNHIANR